MNLLVIEDNEGILDFLKQSFKAEGYVVDTAEEGEAGLRKALANSYDVIILDIGLPRVSGSRIVSELRAAGNTTPILVLSVQEVVNTKTELLDIGADDYLTKPFSFTELAARVRALLRRPRNTVTEILTLGELVLDTRRHVVMLGDDELHLTPKEFSMLEYFMRNEGSVLSRAEILQHVWDMNTDPFTNTVETHIVNLRKKLQQGDGKDLIHTVQGAGYKFG